MFSTFLNTTAIALVIIGTTLAFMGFSEELIAFCYALPAGVACADAVHNLMEK
ncbi:MAG: hypothetical protein PVF17_00070 [Ignavibacteria bacterium]|jgi:hypothetical protein